MLDMVMTPETTKTVFDVTARHMRSLNDELAANFPAVPDIVFAAAIGAALSITLASFGDPSKKADVIDAINDVLDKSLETWRLMPLA
jgi:hypothetical protein